MNITRLYATIDTQVFGEAFRIVTQSSMLAKDDSIEETTAYFATHFQFEKNMFLNEPRGHRGMNGCIVVPSRTASFGLVFFNHPMSISFKQEALLAVTTALLEMGLMDRVAGDRYEIETVYGSYVIQATIAEGEVINVAMEVDSCEVIDKEEAYTSVIVGGSRAYQLYPLSESIPTIALPYLATIESWGKKMVKELHQKGMHLEGVVLLEDIGEQLVRTVTFERDGYILRSPSIDVTSAILRAYEVERLTNRSIVNSAVVVEKGSTGRLIVQGEAFVTGSHDFIMDDEDPLQNGFLLA